LIAAIEISDADFGMKTLNYRDTLQFASQAARLRYAVRFVNASGQKAAFSNALLIEPTSKVAANPTALTAAASQDAIKLSWSAPDKNVDGSTPVSILGYNVYRSVSASEPAKLLNASPVSETEYSDEFFDFNKDYFYFIRAVSLGTQAEPIESSESNILKFNAVDTFPPGPPSAITLASAPGMISIFFAVNPEKDIDGYRIFRVEDPNTPKSDWLALTPELLQTNTFQDSRVESGKTYYYFLLATDKRGNVSEMSEIVSETVP
jgi:fibronectin type 3 domain-containing protein